MRTLFILAALVAVALASKHQFHNNHHDNGEEDNHHHKHMKCRGEPVIKNEEYHKAKKECRKEIPRSDEESEGKKSGRACRAVCSLTKVGTLDHKGFIDEHKMKDMIHSAIVNQEARKELEHEIIECGRNATDLGIASSDHKCSNYKPYFECIWISIVEACADPYAHNDGDEAME